MPTYEYACRSCGSTIEVVQSMTDDPLTVCPTCDGELKKVFSPVGIAFKGQGFYKNDSRGSTSSTTPAASTSSSTSTSSDAGTSTPSGSGGSTS